MKNISLQIYKFQTIWKLKKSKKKGVKNGPVPHLQHEGLLHSPVVARTAGEQDAGVSLDRTRLPSDSQSQISKLCTPLLCWQLYPSIITRTGEIIRRSQCLTNNHSPLPSKQYNTVSDFINGIHRLHTGLLQGVGL